MAKPTFSPTQYELRNILPVAVSDEQATQIAQATSRVNEQLNWVAQALGWSGPNYWDSLTNTVHQKRALLGGTFGVYNSYTLLPLKEIRTWEQKVITGFKPNIAIGQRVIIGDLQTYIYDLDQEGDSLILDLGKLPEQVIAYLEQGAAIKVDVPENRPFPFYRPTAEASADAYFRCSVGATTLENNFYRYAELVVSPFDQNNLLLPYTNLTLFAGSYYYFDRAVYVSQGALNLAPWIESQWIETQGLWQIYIPEEIVGNQLSLVWDYALESTQKRVIASTKFQVDAWQDPSDWGNGGSFFNPVLDEYNISRTYNVAGLNYSLGTYLHLGDNAPLGSNPLWFDAGKNILYANNFGDWVPVGQATDVVNLGGSSAPPPITYEKQQGSIWQSPEGNVYVWDAGFQSFDFFYFFSNAIIDGFFIINPSYHIGNLYYYDPDNFLIHCPSYEDAQGFYVYDLTLNDEDFYVSSPCVTAKNWYEISFYNQALFQSSWNPAYASNLYVLVDGTQIPNVFRTDNYEVLWTVDGEYLGVNYRALTDQGETFIPRITIGSNNGTSIQYIDISSDFNARPEALTTVPYNELGVLNNFRGAWGNKGGARSMDFAFDSLDIHGYNEQQALVLKPVNQPLSFDTLLSLVSGSNIYTGDQPPASATIGDYYWNNETGALAVYYPDRDRQLIWIEIDYPASPCQIGTPDCDYFPLKPFLSSGGCFLSNGDTWQDPEAPPVLVWYDSPNGSSNWVEMNWDPDTGIGEQVSQFPSLVPDYNVLYFFLTDEFIPLEESVPYTTPDYTFYYTVQPLDCSIVFYYEALSPLGVQTLPKVWVGINSGTFPPVDISQNVFSNCQWFLAPAVQNSESTLRPWKTQSLEVTDEASVYQDTFFNGLRADINLGPGGEDWTRSFVRLPSEYGRDGRVWNQTKLVMQDFAYFGGPGKLRDMRCPTQPETPQIYDEVVFFRRDPSVGTVLFSAPYIFSDVEGFNVETNYFPGPVAANDGFFDADFDFTTDDQYDEWTEADLTTYEPLHIRTVLSNGDWDGVYLEPTGNRPLTGYVERDLRVKSVIPVPAPVWDASIYKYPPLCPQGPESYVEDPNNFKVNYAYFSADLAAAEDGFFDPSQDVAWREPLVEDQTLYILNN